MNQIIISQFEKLAYQTKQEEGNTFRTKSHFKVLNILKSIHFNITSKNQVNNISGIGISSKKRIDEIIQNGFLKELTNQTNLENDSTKKLADLERITGIGPVKAKKILEKKLTLDKIVSQYKNNTLKESFTTHQLLGIKHFHDLEKRIPYQEINEIESYLKNILDKEYNRCNNSKVELEICGSFRRNQPTSGDIDILFYSPADNDLTNTEVTPLFIPYFLKILWKNKFLVDNLTTLNSSTKYMGMCRYKDNPVRRIDIRYIPYSSIGSAKLYFTGSGEFNKNMRTFANKKGYKLNEYGLFKLKKDKTCGLKIKTRTENDIFTKLGLEYVTPENRIPIHNFNI